MKSCYKRIVAVLPSWPSVQSMFLTLAFLLALLVAGCRGLQPGAATVPPVTLATPATPATPATSIETAKAIANWQAWRFGMFIHWGPVAIKGTEIGWSRGAQVPIEEYDNLYKQFNPTNYNADEWMQVAREAGMKYVVFTTKHHDGFCMFDTKQTDHNIMRSPFGRDVVKELAQAARKNKLAFGTYYSTCDWYHPDFPRTSPGGKVRRETHNLDRYEQYLRAQVKELITQYGPLCTLWFDVPMEFDRTRGQGVVDYVRSLQPDIVINNRTGAPGDFDTPEQRVGKYQDSRPWETCMTICHQWAWKPDDTMKTLEQCLQTLVLCAGGDGNLLFNVGPTPDGVIEKRQVERLKEMGAWLAQYGQSIYGTRGGPWKPAKTVASTRKGNVIYLHVMRWEGDSITLPNLPLKVTSAAVLGGGTATVQQDGDKLTVTVPPAGRKEIDTIIKLVADGSVMEVPAIKNTFAAEVKATASNVYRNQKDQYGPENAFDNDPHTRWASDVDMRAGWIAADFGKPRTVSKVRLSEAESYTNRVQKFEFQYRAEGDWKTLTTGTTIGAKLIQSFPPVTAQEFRLNILEAKNGPTLSEIELLEK
ncbi:MAG: alpha-L-fucosidase [Verrucomicrobiota bacterium]